MAELNFSSMTANQKVALYAALFQINRAVRFIDDHAGSDLSMADIAAAANVSIRAVQLAFRRGLDLTPLGYLRQVRLERAHCDLPDGPGTGLRGAGSNRHIIAG